MVWFTKIRYDWSELRSDAASHPISVRDGAIFLRGLNFFRSGQLMLENFSSADLGYYVRCPNVKRAFVTVEAVKSRWSLWPHVSSESMEKSLMILLVNHPWPRKGKSRLQTRLLINWERRGRGFFFFFSSLDRENPRERCGVWNSNCKENCSDAIERK